MKRRKRRGKTLDKKEGRVPKGGEGEEAKLTLRHTQHSLGAKLCVGWGLRGEDPEEPPG